MIKLVDNLLRKGAIEIVPKFDDQFISTILLHQKRMVLIGQS
jgi:hypothetical protein